MRNTALGNTYINIIYAIEDLEKVGKFSLCKFLKNNCYQTKWYLLKEKVDMVKQLFYPL